MFNPECTACKGNGFLLVTRGDDGEQEIQRCDDCAWWTDDSTMLQLVYQLAEYGMNEILKGYMETNERGLKPNG